MKKAISVLLLVCMVSALCSAGAYATGGNASGEGGSSNAQTGSLSFNETAISLDLNGTKEYTLVGHIVVVSPDGYEPTEYKWVSSSESCATVAPNGTITAKSVGTTNITGTVTFTEKNPTEAANPKTVTATTETPAVVTVTDSTPTEPTISASITNNNDGTLTVNAAKDGNTATIVSVIWSSDNSSVIVNGNGGNNATATFTSTDLYSAQTATITAMVTLDDNKTTSPTISVTIPRSVKTISSVSVTFDSTTNKASATPVLSNDGAVPSIRWTWSANPNTAVTLMHSGSDSGSTCTVVNNTYAPQTIKLTVTAEDTTDSSNRASYTTDNITIPGTPREVSAKLSPNADPLTVGDTTNTKTLVAYYKDDSAQTPIEGVTWVATAQNPANGNIANLNGNIVTAGSVPGTVTYEAYLNNAATGATVTVTVNAAKSNVNLNISQLNKPANVDGFTITAKGGVISLAAAATDATTGAALNGTYSWFISSAPISDGIGLTDNKNATATVSGKYNGSGSNAYTVGVTFTPSDTTKYDVKNTYCAINVKFAHVIDSGNNQVWDGRNGMSFITNDSYYNCSYDVRIDGQLIGNGNGYTVVSSPDGRMLVTLTPDCLKYIATYYNGNGTHTISIGNKNAAAATGYFRTWGTASSFNGVKTGDDANPGLWAALLAVSAVGAGAAVIIVKRRKTNNG